MFLYLWLRGDFINEEQLSKVECPYCGYKMPIRYGKNAIARGIFVQCKGRNCKKYFEIKISVK